MKYVIDIFDILDFFDRDDVNFAEVARKTGISKMTLSNLRTHKSNIMNLKFSTIATLQVYIDNYFFNDDVIKILKFDDFDVFIYKDKVDMIYLKYGRSYSAVLTDSERDQLNELYRNYIRLTDEDYANDNYDLIFQTIQDVDYLISKHISN